MMRNNTYAMKAMRTPEKNSGGTVQRDEETTVTGNPTPIAISPMSNTPTNMLSTRFIFRKVCCASICSAGFNISKCLAQNPKRLHVVQSGIPQTPH